MTTSIVSIGRHRVGREHIIEHGCEASMIMPDRPDETQAKFSARPLLYYSYDRNSQRLIVGV